MPYTLASSRLRWRMILLNCDRLSGASENNFDSRGALNQFQARAILMLLQGCGGAMLEVVLAMAAAHVLFPPDGRPSSAPAGLLSWNIQNIRFEPREKSFYLLSLLLGPTGAFLATRWAIRSTIPYFGFVVLLAIPPFGNVYARSILQGDLPAWVGFSVVILLGGTYISLLKYYGVDAKLERIISEEIRPNESLWIYIFILGILTLVVVPSSFEAVAARIGMEMHVVSFFIGPSLYFLGHELLPGVDYYAQYGLGLGWIFSFFLGKTAEITMVHYAMIAVASVWIFYGHLIWLLKWLYQSWLAAAVISLLAVIMLFHTDRPFFDPSSFVLRYPLLTICAASLVRWAATPNGWIQLLSLAFVLAAALFIETETGIIMVISVMLAFVVTAPRSLASVILVVKLGTASVIFLFLLLLLVFGWGALSGQFLSGAVAPLTIYGVAGFGGWPISWTLREWNWLYNFVAPGVALATLGIIAHTSRSGIDLHRAALIVFFAASGLLMMAKFINMSIVAVWQVNALGFLVVLGWWGVSIARCLPRRLDLTPLATFPIRGAVVALMLIPAVALATTSTDQRNPALYAFKSWLTYPSLLLAPFHSLHGCNSMECVANRPDARDVALIRERTRPGEQVAIVGDLYDWTYLINAHRPPMLAFLPSAVIFSQRQLEESWRRMAVADYWFIPIDPKGAPVIDNPDLGALAIPMLKRDFVREGIGERLGVWKRKSPDAGGALGD